MTQTSAPAPVPFLNPYQQCVVVERVDLTEKLTKLDTLLSGGTYASLPPAEQTRLSRQFLIMQLYEQVLAERISAFSLPGGQGAGSTPNKDTNPATPEKKP